MKFIQDIKALSTDFPYYNFVKYETFYRVITTEQDVSLELKPFFYKLKFFGSIPYETNVLRVLSAELERVKTREK